MEKVSTIIGYVYVIGVLAVIVLFGLGRINNVLAVNLYLLLTILFIVVGTLILLIIRFFS